MQWMCLLLLCSTCGVHSAHAVADVSTIINEAYAYLESHLCEGEKWNLSFHFYRPSLQKYSPDQWLWDSGSHMIVWSHRNVSNAILDMRTMMLFAQANGRIPEMIFWGARTPAQNRQILLQYSSDQFTDLTQMPVLPFSLRAIYNASKDPAVLHEFLHPLVAYFRWWAANRDVSGTGLVSVCHGWESGLDASPVYDDALNVHDPQPPYAKLYPKFIELIEDYKHVYKWNQTDMFRMTHAPFVAIDGYFVVEDVGVNAVYAAGWRTLRDLALEIGDTALADECSAAQLKVEQAIIRLCWDDDLKQFVSRYYDKKKRVQHSTPEVVQSLLPILLETLPSTIKHSLINRQITNTSRFWLKYPLPSVSQADPAFNPVFTADLMWRGPTWAFPTWFVMEGLTLHGEHALVEQLLDKWIALVQVGGISEMYNPLTGAPYGAEGLGMSTLIVDWIYRLNRH